MRRKRNRWLSWLVLMFLLCAMAAPPGLAAAGPAVGGEGVGTAREKEAVSEEVYAVPGNGDHGQVIPGAANPVPGQGRSRAELLPGRPGEKPASPAAGKGGGPQVIVRYREGVFSGQAAKGVGRILTSTVTGPGTAAVDLVELDAGLDLEQALKDLRARSDILYAEPNYPVRAFQAPDPVYDEQWGLQNPSVQGNVYGIAAAPAWAALATAGGSKR